MKNEPGSLLTDLWRDMQQFDALWQVGALLLCLAAGWFAERTVYARVAHGAQQRHRVAEHEFRPFPAHHFPACRDHHVRAQLPGAGLEGDAAPGLVDAHAGESGDVRFLPHEVVDGERLVHLCSNNYLGLAAEPRVVEAAIEATRRYGAGSGASRLVSGGAALHRSLEERIATWKGTEDAILFSSGYLANTGTIAALAGRGDRILKI